MCIVEEYTAVEGNSKPHKVVYSWLRSKVIALNVYLKLMKVRRLLYLEDEGHLLR